MLRYVIFAACAAAACGKGASSAETPAPASAPAGGWVEFLNEEGNFAVKLPRTPDAQPVPKMDPRFTTRAWGFLAADRRSEYGIGFTRYPEAIEGAGQPKLLDGGRNGLLRGFGATLVSERDVELDGHKGREFDFKTDTFPDISGPVVGRARVFIIGDASYQLMLIRAADAPDGEPARFFESFRLLRPVNTVDPALADVVWKEYHFGAERLSVLGPEKMVGDKMILADNPGTLLGKPATLHVIGFKVPHRAAVYAVRWTDVAGTGKIDAAKLFDSARDELAARSKLKVEIFADTEISGHPGKRLTGSAAPGMEYDAKNLWFAEARLVLVGRRLYEIVVVAPEQELKHPDVPRFLASLRVGE